MGNQISLVALACRLDHHRDVEEVDFFLEELSDRFLIGGIHDGRHRAAGPPCRVGQLHAGVLGGIGRTEGQLSHLREIQPAPWCFQPGGPAQAIKDR